MNDVELVKIWQEVIKNGGTWDDVVKAYRDNSDTKAKTESLKCSISNRLAAIRKELSSRGLDKSKILDILPMMSKKTTRSMDAVIDFLIPSEEVVE